MHVARASLPAGFGEVATPTVKDPARRSANPRGRDFLAAEEGTTLFRAVEPGELADIRASGAYRVPEGIGGGKYFYSSAEQAERLESAMGSVGAVAQEVGIPIRNIGGLALIRGTDAPALIDALASEGLRILGIEGFELEGSEVRPDMGLIADFSTLTDAGQSVWEARRFIESAARPDAFFEFSLAGELSPS